MRPPTRLPKSAAAGSAASDRAATPKRAAQKFRPAEQKERIDAQDECGRLGIEGLAVEAMARRHRHQRLQIDAFVIAAIGEPQPAQPKRERRDDRNDRQRDVVSFDEAAQDRAAAQRQSSIRTCLRSLAPMICQ
ncbi:MAG TPA: hypothetical protein VMU87_22930 [Stellaceae bacterium]|nr:hypothetical protein [Stellaceae bacterium]